MDVERLMKNDELRRPCTKENDQQNNCLCAQCLHKNGIVNHLNDEKSLTSSTTNSLNQLQYQLNNKNNTLSNLSINSNNNSLNTKKIQLNPIASIKNFINSTTTTTATTNGYQQQQTNSITKQIDTNHNSLNCLNHSKDGHTHKFNQDNDSIHNDDDNLNLILNNSNNDWYIHCHQKDLNKHLDKNESANRRLLITTILCFFFLITELIGKIN